MNSDWSGLQNLLKPRERLACRLYYLEGMTQNVVAECLAISQGAVSRMLGRASKKCESAGLRIRDFVPDRSRNRDDKRRLNRNGA